MTHFSQDLLLDAALGEETPELREHLRQCEACATVVEETRVAIDLASDARVPEPSPLYWESFRRQVGRRIDGRERWARVLRLGSVAAAAAAAALVVGLRIGPSAVGPQMTPMVAPLPAWSALPAAEEDFGLAVLQALGSEVPEATVQCSSLEACVVSLSEEESAALAAALKQELGERAL